MEPYDREGDGELTKMKPQLVRAFSPGYTHDYWGADSNFYYLRYSCGTACWGVRVLPKKEGSLSKDFPYPIFHSENFNYLIAGNPDNEEQLFVIDTRQKVKARVNIKKKDCFETFYIDCVEAEVENGSIWVKYPDNIKEKYKLGELKWSKW
jgi:hypothetical protein